MKKKENQTEFLKSCWRRKNHVQRKVEAEGTKTSMSVGRYK